jgi:hypothetical protein
MTETIRQFAEEQLAETTDVAAVRALHARHYAERAVEALTWWGDALRQRESAEWFQREIANLRAGFRTAADSDDLDAAAMIAVSAAVLGSFIGSHEPSIWSEELIAPALATDHPQLAALYGAASMCAASGRVDDGTRYADRARALFDDSRYERIPFGLATMIVAWPYLQSGRPEVWIEFCRAEIDRGGDAAWEAPGTLLLALAMGGRQDEAVALAPSALAAAEASGNLAMLNAALVGYSAAFFDRDPPAALAAQRRAATIGEALGMAGVNTALLARHEAAYGDPGAALEACRESLMACGAAGDVALAKTPLGVLASLLHRIERDECAAVVAGCAESPVLFGYPEVAASIEHLRETLGEDDFDALAQRGRTMDTATMFRYALEQIDDVGDAVAEGTS